MDDGSTGARPLGGWPRAETTYSDVAVDHVFEDTVIGLAIADPDGSFVRVNAAFCRMVGHDGATLCSMRFEDIVHPDDRESSRLATEDLLAGRGERVVVEKRHLVGDGRTLWVRSSRSLLRRPDGSPKYLLLHVVPLTDLKVVEGHLERGESLRRIAGSLTHVGGWSFELGTGAAFWSEEMYEITGFDTDGPPPVEVTLARYPSPANQQLVAAMEACRTHGTPYDLELPFDRPDGVRIVARCVAEAVRGADGEVVEMRGALQDVTTQHEAAAECQQLAARLTATMNSITDGLYTLDETWRFTYVNPRAETLLARSTGSLLGRELWTEFPNTVGSQLDEAYHRAVTEQQPVVIDEFHYEPLDLWLEVRSFPSAAGLMVVFRDIGERRALLAAERRAREEAERASAVLEYEATHDALTGLPNRAEAIARLTATGADDATVVLVDLDGLKRVNEALGRDAGDELLLSVAHRLRELTRGAGLLARVGGDKFALLLTGPAADADRLAGELLESLRTPISAAGQRLYVTAGIGLAHAVRGVGGDQVLRDAEVALHSAKADGPNQAAWYDPVLEVDVKGRLAIAAELHDALRGDQFLLHYQPHFDLASGRVAGVEALARWQHPEQGLLPPGLFIPVAEDTGLIEPLGDWALGTALATARPWTRQDPEFVVWVNVAVRQLRRRGLARTIAERLEATGTPPHQFGIEITESALADDTSIMLSELLAISELGVQIAIDDFGTGYSSLSRLTHLPVDVLKIDRSFVGAMGTGQGAATVHAIVGLAHALRARVIAEGVENPAQLAGLREAGCDQVSGFLLARPTPANEVRGACTAGRGILLTPVSAEQTTSDMGGQPTAPSSAA